MTLENESPAKEDLALSSQPSPYFGRKGTGDAQLFQILIAAVEDYAIYMLDPTGNVVTWNKGATRSKGYTEEEIVGRNYRCFFTAGDIAEGIPERQLEQAKEDGHYAAEGWRLRQDGHPFWAGISLTAIHSSDGKLQGFAKVTRDLTDVKARQEALRVSEASLQQEKELLRVTLESIAESVVCVDSDGLVTLMNNAAERTIGRRFNEVRAKPIEELMPIVDVEGQNEVTPLRGALNGDGGHARKEDYVLKNGSGESLVIECWTAPVKKPDGIRLGAVAVFHDVTRERASLQNLEFHASHDPLTGLLNRRGFKARMGTTMLYEVTGHPCHTLCFIDLDRFKEVNDSGGHDAGDALLKCVASIMKKELTPADLIGRLGGDEFAILLQGSDRTTAESTIARIQTAIREMRCEWHGRTLRISLSIGLCSFTNREYIEREMMKRADLACYDAKAAGGDCLRSFSPGCAA
jgi:diguanylate cyclase (GGDEF)-like protein/PAS domain S-box-containing protein